MFSPATLANPDVRLAFYFCYRVRAPILNVRVFPVVIMAEV